MVDGIERWDVKAHPIGLNKIICFRWNGSYLRCSGCTLNLSSTVWPILSIARTPCRSQSDVLRAVKIVGYLRRSTSVARNVRILAIHCNRSVVYF